MSQSKTSNIQQPQSNLGLEISRANSEMVVNWISLYKQLLRCGVINNHLGVLPLVNPKKPNIILSESTISKKRKHSQIEIYFNDLPERGSRVFHSFLKRKGWTVLTNTTWMEQIFELWRNQKFVKEERSNKRQRRSQRNDEPQRQSQRSD